MDKKAVEAVMKELTPNMLLQMVEESNESTFNIGDKVILTSSHKEKVYTIYSITTYMGGRVVYTIWVDDEYENVEDWQIKKYIQTKPIGLTTDK